MTLQEAISAAYAADDAWTAVLKRVYGKKMGDARYDGRGRATPLLASLCDAKRAADEAMGVAFAAQRAGATP